MGPSLHGAIQLRPALVSDQPMLTPADGEGVAISDQLIRQPLHPRLPWYQTNRCWRRPTAKALILSIS